VSTAPVSGQSTVDSSGVASSFVEIRNLKMHFPVTQGTVYQKTVAHVKAVDGVSFNIAKGETLGLVGESGCGKTTIGRCILQLESASEGEILFSGEDLTQLNQKQLGPIRQKNSGDLSGSIQFAEPENENRQHVGRTHACAQNHQRCG